MHYHDRIVMCTRCPTPCRSCASDSGRGAYCATVPCLCLCHAASKPHEDRTPAERMKVVQAREIAVKTVRNAVRCALEPFKDELDRRLVIDGLERVVIELRIVEDGS